MIFGSAQLPACLPAVAPPHAQSAAALLCLESSDVMHGRMQASSVGACFAGHVGDRVDIKDAVVQRRCCALKELEYGVAVDAMGHAIRIVVLFVRERGGWGGCVVSVCARDNHRGTCTQLVIGATCARHPQPSLHCSCCTLTLDPSQ